MIRTGVWWKGQCVCRLPAVSISAVYYFRCLYFYYRYLRMQSLENGATGLVQFNDDGDRLNPVYDVVNVKKDGLFTVGKFSASQVCTSYLN